MKRKKEQQNLRKTIKPPWSKREVVFPWDLKHFLYTLRERDNVFDYLRRAKYPVDRLRKRPRKSVVIDATSGVMEYLLQKKWVVAASSHVGLLQAIALTVPASFALTTLEPCRTVSTAELLRLFSAKVPENIWDDDPAGESYDQILHTGLLVWTSVTEATRGSELQHGRFSDLLMNRGMLGFPIMFTAVYSAKFDTHYLDNVMGSIETLLGTAAMVMIKEKATVLNFKMESAALEHVTVELKEKGEKA